MKSKIKESLNIEETREIQFREMYGFTFAFEKNVMIFMDEMASAEIRPAAIIYEENDEFYFTDYITNEEKKYTVTSKFTTSSTDVSFYNMPSDNPMIAMQCCLTPDDTENVLIVMAKAEN